MRLRLPAMTIALGALTIGATSGSAQTLNAHIGPRVSYNFEVEEFGLGAQFSLPIARRLELYPSFDYFFVDPGSLTSFNIDLKYRVPAANFNWLYLGGGLNITRRSVGDFSESNTGVNLLAGYESLRGSVHPFAEARLTAGDGTAASLAAGLNITIGHSHR